MQGARIHITGIVQGVGFRPFVYNLAARLNLKGWVRNTSAGVDIEVDGERDALQAFLKALRDEAPPLARIDELTASFRPANGFNDFGIIHSEAVPAAFLPIPPDVAVCGDCLRELFDPADRRYRYPFINCTNCGPRFTIIKDIPYDRPNTTMVSFPMCPDCEREYNDPSNRRFHAQPVACPLCGPHLWLERSNVSAPGRSAENDDALLEAQRLLSEGKIVAIKGLGGFHLACDATKPHSVSKLRARKLRVDKPFAIMMPDMETIERHCLVSDAERQWLTSPARPIVLLRRKAESNIAPEVAPRQDTLGVMLPYTPLHYLLFTNYQFTSYQPLFSALVMTSGNLSEEPIATTNDEARRRLSQLADAFLMHDRDIHIRCDDSVVRVFDDGRLTFERLPSSTAHHPPFTVSRSPSTVHRPSSTIHRPSSTVHRPSSTVHRPSSVYPIRRSRGYSPFPVKLSFDAPQLLAVGAELKNTFCLTNKRHAFLSHHIGDMENYETLKSFEQGVNHFERLFRVKPEAIAHDLHPDYLATQYAFERAERENLPTVAVQHHHAHIAACMAEHGLNEPVIGAAFDGTGFGEDGAIWGGEFLVTEYKSYWRAAHLEYFPLPGGDAAIRRPSRTALALLWSLDMPWEADLAPVKDFSAEELVMLRKQLEKQINTPLTSSVGRFFDAAAALAGVRQSVNYEGQAAIEFEALADETEAESYVFGVETGRVEVRGVLEALVRDVRDGIPLSKISARFHNGLAQAVRETIRKIGRDTEIRVVVLSGGVWQNLALLRRTWALLQQDGFTLYIHREVPPNDGGLSLGQAGIAAARLRG